MPIVYSRFIQVNVTCKVSFKDVVGARLLWGVRLEFAGIIRK